MSLDQRWLLQLLMLEVLQLLALGDIKQKLLGVAV